MPCVGDMFFVEDLEYTVRLYVWMGHGIWDKGPLLRRLRRAPT
jgi:hypothetical protein